MTAETAVAPLKFYDNAAYVFPDDATHVMEYSDGNYTPAATGHPPMWTLYPYVHDITVYAGAKAWHSQFCDFEQFNGAYYSPGADRAWTEQRLNRGLRVVWYSDRANLHKLAINLGPLLFRTQLVQFWIPTLDDGLWTAASLSVDIAAHWGVSIPPARIWGNQYAGEGSGSGGSWDISRLFGSWD